MHRLRPAGWAALVVLVGVSVVHLVAQWASADTMADVTQPLLMPLLALGLYAEAPAPRNRLVSLTLLALGFSWLGDTLPRFLAEDLAFVVMMACFLAAQITYIKAFRPYVERSVLHRRRGLLAAYALAVGGLLVACVPGAGALLMPVLLYGACLGAMAVLSTGVNAVAGIGGALFLVSDGLIALEAFADGFSLAHQGFWVMLTYVFAQLFIVAGVLAGRNDRATRSAPRSTPRSRRRPNAATP